jgi:hypothetical protein
MANKLIVHEDKAIDQMSDYTKLMNRYKSAAGDWDNWKSLYMEAYDYTFPDKNPYYEEYDDTPGQRKNLQVYDNTQCIGARQLVSKLHANLVPPSLQWFELEPSELVTDENQKKAIQTSLQQLTAIIYNYINGSNFDLAINEAFHDMVIGTMAFQVFPTDDDKHPIIFKTCPIDNLAPEQDAFDQVNTVWREFEDLCFDDILLLWPDGKIADSMKLTHSQNPQSTYSFVEGVIYDHTKKDYRIVVMWEEQPWFVVDKRSISTPWVVGRWSKSAREIGGRGPAIQALPTARTVNMMARFLIEAAAMNATPPWLGFSDGVFNPNTYVIQPNTIIPISPESAANMPLRKLDVTGDVQFGELTMNDLRSQINSLMYVDPVRPVQSPSQTATEIMIRQQQFLESIAPAFARIEIEVLPKLIKRVIFLLMEKGLLPSELNSPEFRELYRVRFKSPLEQSQQLQDVQKLMQYDAAMKTIAGEQGSILSYNLPQLPTYLGMKFDIDLSLILSPEQIQEKMDAASAMTQPNPNENEAPDSVESTAMADTPEEMGVEQ